MLVFKNLNYQIFKEIVETHAKYQKVMLIFDDDVSNLDIKKNGRNA